MQHEADLATPAVNPEEQRVLGLLGWLWLHPATQSRSTDPWDSLAGWRLAGEAWQRAEVNTGERHSLQYQLQPGRHGRENALVRDGEETISLQWSVNGAIRQVHIQNGTGPRRETELTAIGQPPAAVALFARGESWVVRVNHPEIDLAETDIGSLTAPMHGRVVALHCQAGDRVSAGQPLVVMEAMKMEHTVTAPADGVVTEVFCHQDENLGSGHTLLSFEADGTGDA